MIPSGDKSTWEDQALSIVRQGYPAIADQLPYLIEWLSDMNWPGAVIIADFLVTIGAPLVPHVRHALASTDDVWKYWVITQLCTHWPRDLVVQIVPELGRLAAGTDMEGVSDAASSLLIQHGLA